MTGKTKLIISTMVVVGAFAFGRFSAPEKVKIEVKTVEVERKDTTTDTDRNKRKETTVTETTNPDGTKSKVTKTVEDTNTQRKTTTIEDKVTQSEKTKEVTKSGTNVTVDALVGFSRMDPTTPIYGAHLGANILGPIRVGLFGMTDATLGLTVGLQF